MFHKLVNSISDNGFTNGTCTCTSCNLDIKDFVREELRSTIPLHISKEAFRKKRKRCQVCGYKKQAKATKIRKQKSIAQSVTLFM